jgi:hypothetical protein
MDEEGKKVLKALFGENVSEKWLGLEDSLNEIEEKYSDFFQSQESFKYPGEKNRLHDHYVIITEGNKITFGFEPRSDLPLDIKNDCLAAFMKWYPKV